MLYLNSIYMVYGLYWFVPIYALSKICVLTYARNA